MASLDRVQWSILASNRRMEKTWKGWISVVRDDIISPESILTWICKQTARCSRIYFSSWPNSPMIHLQCPTTKCIRFSAFIVCSIANIYLLLEYENIAFTRFTAQFQAGISWCNIVVVEKLCTHRLRLLGPDDGRRVDVKSLCNRWLIKAIRLHNFRTGKKESLTPARNHRDSLINLITHLHTRRHPIFLLRCAYHHDKQLSRNYLITTTTTTQTAMASD